MIFKVEIYPSLFGLERMKKDSMFGPPKEIFQPEDIVKEKKLRQLRAKNIKKKSKHGGTGENGEESSSSSDSQEELEAMQTEKTEMAAAYDQAKLRSYELQKMKYYYAVVHCNSPKTATYLYDEFNGFEFEDSMIILNMSIIPDDV